MLLMLVIFYFLLIRPQQQKAKERAEMMGKVRRGDTVVTSGGFVGRVTRVLRHLGRDRGRAVRSTQGPRAPGNTARSAVQERSGHRDSGEVVSSVRAAAAVPASRERRGHNSSRFGRLNKVEPAHAAFLCAYILAILAICLLGLLIPVPNFLSKEAYDRLPAFAQHKIGLGLDLRGGAHLLTKMDMDELRRSWMNNIVDQARAKLREAKIGFTGLGPSGGGVKVSLAKTDAADIDAAMKALRPIAQMIGGALGSGNYDLDIKSDGTGGITITPTEPGLNERAAQAIATAVEIIRNRLDPGGIKEYTIQRQGTDRILVQAPGVEDATEIKKLLGETAKLTFHLLHPTMSAEEAANTRVPAGYELLPSDERQGERYKDVKYLIDKRELLTGENLVDAQPGFDSRTNEPVVTFRFDPTAPSASAR